MRNVNCENDKHYSAFTILSVFEASTRQPWVLEAFLWQFLVLVKVLLKSLGIALVQSSLKCFCFFLVLVRVCVQTSTISISFPLEDDAGLAQISLNSRPCRDKNL